LLRNDHFQIAYATNDIARARDVFSGRYGLREYQNIEGEMPGDGYIRVSLAWSGGTMFELVQAEGPAGAFYNRKMPSEGFAIYHHHFGYFIQSEAEWEALKAEIERGGWPVVARFNQPGTLEAWYIEVPELGHFLEFIYPEPAGLAFFESVPVS
jgi:extradiol dioxygenase family protein